MSPLKTHQTHPTEGETLRVGGVFKSKNKKVLIVEQTIAHVVSAWLSSWIGWGQEPAVPFLVGAPARRGASDSLVSSSLSGGGSCCSAPVLPCFGCGFGGSTRSWRRLVFRSCGWGGVVVNRDDECYFVCAYTSVGVSTCKRQTFCRQPRLLQ